MKTNPLIFLRSLVFNIAFFCWSMCCSIIFAPLFICSHRLTLKAGKPWAAGTLFLARLICGIRYEVRGMENISDSPVIYASKHQSAWDTVIFHLTTRYPAFILKRELLRIPLWGWYLWRMHMIAIDRSGKASSMKQMIRDAKEQIDAGRPIIIYPEGTRRPVDAEPVYHPGVVALYSQLNVPVVPVALNSGMFWGKNAFIKRPGKIIIEFLPAIAPGGDKKEFLPALQSRIETATQSLIKESS